MLRIIAGEFGGRRIPVPAVDGLRPTGERVREALFSILGDAVAGSRVLDAYAGSGALGIEALSRGAAHVTFVEAAAAAARGIEQTVATLRVEQRCRVVCGRVREVLGRAMARGPFELILADPPWPSREGGPFLARVAELGLLADGGCLVLERAAREASPPPPAGLRHARAARYGDTALDLYSKAADTGRDRSTRP